MVLYILFLFKDESVISGNVISTGLEDFLKAIYWICDNEVCVWGGEGAGKSYNYLNQFSFKAKKEVSNVVLSKFDN